MELAQRIEKKLITQSQNQQRRPNSGYSNHRTLWNNRLTLVVARETRLPQGNELSMTNHGGDMTWQLTESELQIKGKNGLCYRFDDNWNPGHQCCKKELNVLLVDDRKDEENDKLPLPAA